MAAELFLTRGVERQQCREQNVCLVLRVNQAVCVELVGGLMRQNAELDKHGII